MTILLYEYSKLEERASKHLKAWKACHLMLYAFAGVFGILNYIILRNTMGLVDNNCVLYPRELAFRNYEAQINNSSINGDTYKNMSAGVVDVLKNVSVIVDTQKNESVIVADALKSDPTDVQKNGSFIVADEKKNDVGDSTNVLKNETAVHGIETEDLLSDDDSPRVILDISRTLFGHESDCQFAEYMPIMSTIFAAAWVTMFTMCPGGEHPRSGLQQPWRILAPALLFAVVLVGLTGNSFARTNGGLHAFCSAFYNVTNATDCESASPFLERSWGAAWGLGARAAAVRAASAAAWAAWAATAALLFARCLAAPDFQLRTTKVYLKDPQRKLTPYLKKKQRTPQSPVSPSKRDTISVRSEPTMTTEVVTASIEQGQDTAPPSLQATPVWRGHRPEEMELKSPPVRNS